MAYDVNKIRNDFPILHQTVYGKTLVYFDNAATTQKPDTVIDAITKAYTEYNSNIHRGIHYLSAKTTDIFENSRKIVKEFINASHAHEIIFTSGTTASVNNIAYSFGEAFIKSGDEVLISGMEHHSNIVPWQIICNRYQAKLKVIPINNQGELMMDAYEKLITDKTKIIAITHVSNTLGTINPVREIISIAHKHNIPVLIDGAQAVHHMKVDVQELDADFYVFSGHKAYGPTGIGVLYGKEHWLEQLPPFMGGGDMIKSVTFEKTIYNDLPFKFEAGTANYVGAIGLGAAFTYLKSVGLDQIEKHESDLMQYARKSLQQVKGISVFGTDQNKAGSVSLLIDQVHHADAGMVLDKLGVAVRTGNHCTQPIMEYYGITGTIRASFAMYNTREEIDIFVKSLNKVIDMFG